MDTEKRIMPPGTEVVVTIPDNTIAIANVVTTITMGEFAGSVVVSLGPDEAMLIRAENVNPKAIARPVRP